MNQIIQPWKLHCQSFRPFSLQRLYEQNDRERRGGGTIFEKEGILEKGQKGETGQPFQLRKILPRRTYSIVMQLGLLGLASFFSLFLHKHIPKLYVSNFKHIPRILLIKTYLNFQHVQSRLVPLHGCRIKWFRFKDF